MKTSFVKYGRKDDKDLCEITLANSKGTEVKVLNYGATLEKVLLNGENMILSLDTPLDYSKERNYLGGTVGRVCGRIRHGQWGVKHMIVQLPLNEGKNHIHGGKGTDMRVWDFSVFADDNTARVDLTLLDSDFNNGFPGNMKIMASYELDEEDNLRYNITAISDKMTIFNPSNHTYFNLGESAKDLNMQINADYYIPVGKDGLPLEGMESVKNTAFDFTKQKKISEALACDDDQIKGRNGLDHPFILNGMQPAAVLTGKKHRLIVTTDAPALVVYTGNHFDHTGLAKKYGQYDGVTFEAQCPPAYNSDLDEITLVPGEVFERNICWSFE
ncbi:aldose epimerase family protein [Lactobacillus sp. LL6]|uniref:aldose epimerase family protein n=1 Tax=Lactobacillus sp. LL6 TaxID=2596827 RepID=UPI001185AEB7|nr:aldose epimerase family protein [Lactobacillus sp. LL6]TSO26556.1 galactose mutarotase [Lactobacillus sp. LL6]